MSSVPHSTFLSIMSTPFGHFGTLVNELSASVIHVNSVTGMLILASDKQA